MRKLLGVLALAAAAVVASPGCESGEVEGGPSRLGSSPAPRVSRGAPVVTGVAIEAATGRPLEGVTVKLPDGTSAVTDGGGRFELVGMESGLVGLLEASHPSGLVGSNRLLPLAGGHLQVVVRLRRDRERR